MTQEKNFLYFPRYPVMKGLKLTLNTLCQFKASDINEAKYFTSIIVQNTRLQRVKQPHYQFAMA